MGGSLQSWLGQQLGLAPELPEWLQASAALAGQIAYLPPVWVEIH